MSKEQRKKSIKNWNIYSTFMRFFLKTSMKENNSQPFFKRYAVELTSLFQRLRGLDLTEIYQSTVCLMGVCENCDEILSVVKA